MKSPYALISQESEENPNSGATAGNLAYVIYTSGSTGKPKGVAIEHKPLLNYCTYMVERLTLSIGETFAMVQPLTVDACITALFPSLVSGGVLHVVSRERASSPQLLSDYFRRYTIDLLKIAPSHLAALQAVEQPNLIMPSRCLVIGGEEPPWDWIQSLQSLAPGCTILNHYGPTEATVAVLTHKVEEAPADSRFRKTPIGRPIANTEIYLLDSYLQPVPVGVAGELHIGGDSLARGYLNRPQLTAERFIPNPFSNEQGARLYKTGDLARYLPDGSMEFLGRVDNQVKIRGFRVEPGEIEATLGKHEAVVEAAVVARQDERGESRLVAYLVLNQQQPSTFNDLRSFLKQQLPEHMIPSAFVSLASLPLTSHGKLDRLALPAPDQIAAHPKAAFVAPRTSIEEVLADIWAHVLRLKRVGVHDNFFELGGDSILSIQIIARANQAGIRLVPKQVFQWQTIAELASVANTTPMILAEQGAVTGTLPLTPIQHRFFERNITEPHHYNQAILLEVGEPLERSCLETVVRQLLVHHDALRLRFIPNGTGWRQVNAAPDDTVPFSSWDLSDLPAIKQEAAIDSVAVKLQASLDLSNGPIVRVAYFKLGGYRPGRLLIVVHHLAIDGVSWRVLLQDIETACRQVGHGEAIQLPLKTTSFKYWAKRLTEYAHSTSDQELDYWLTLSNAPVPRLPVDLSKGPNTVASARTVSVLLSAEETQALLQDVPSAYQTQINDVLLTALAQAFSDWSGARLLLIDLEGHGREEIVDDVDLSRTLGWFTSIFPVLLDLDEESNLPGALVSIKEQLRSIPNRGIGYGLLRYLSPSIEIRERVRSLPQPEVSFNYLGQFDQAFQKGSVFRVTREPVGPNRSLTADRAHLLEINGSVVENRLQIDFTYSENLHRRATIEELAGGFEQALRTLINHCQSSEAGGYTVSDFVEAGLSQEALDDLITELDQSAE